MACGISYGFCGISPQSHHCDYPPVLLSQDIAKQLQQVMPSYTHGSCLERHEWNKHGSCQLKSSDDYFKLASSFVLEFNKSPVATFVQKNIGKEVKRDILQNKIDESFGKGTKEKIFLGCKDNTLVDIYIALPALIKNEDKLVTLLQSATPLETTDGCGASFTISDFTSE
jgi:ribonuclease T2